MSDVTEVTRKILRTNPSYLDAIANSIANYRSIARQIIPKIENELKVKPSIEAIVNIIRRTDFNKMDLDKIKEIISKSKIELKSDVVILQLKENEQDISKIFNSKKKFIYAIGSPEYLTVILDEDLMKELKLKNQFKLEKGLSAIKIISPEEIADTAGVISFMIKELMREQINIEELVSRHNETNIIVNNTQAALTFECIQNLIHECRL